MSTLQVVSNPMLALTRTTDRDYYTRAANEDFINGGPWSRTKFAYDALGQRITKTGSGTTTNFLYDGDQVVQELSGGTPAANLLTGLGMDDIFSRTDSAGPRYFLTDALGSTVALADANATLQTSYTYEPYGKTTASGTASTNPYQYSISSKYIAPPPVIRLPIPILLSSQ